MMDSHPSWGGGGGGVSNITPSCFTPQNPESRDTTLYINLLAIILLTKENISKYVPEYQVKNIERIRVNHFKITK